MFRHLISVKRFAIKLLNANMTIHKENAVISPTAKAVVTIAEDLFLSLSPETSLLTVSGNPLDTNVSITIYTEKAI